MLDVPAVARLNVGVIVPVTAVLVADSVPPEKLRPVPTVALETPPERSP